MDSNIEKINKMIDNLVAGSSLFLVDIFIKPTNNIKVFLDGDEGVTIDAVSKLNRALYKQLEEEALYPEGDFSLEVSSAGIDTPLKFLRQYKKNIGRKVEITLQDDQVYTGVLKGINEEVLQLETTTGKKKEIQTMELPFSNIKSTIVQVSFKS